jgi:hypothetical protein
MAALSEKQVGMLFANRIVQLKIRSRRFQELVKKESTCRPPEYPRQFLFVFTGETKRILGVEERTWN